MQAIIYDRLGHEWVALRMEGTARLPVEEQTKEIFEQLDAALHTHGMSLANTMRTRLWGRDRESRDGGSRVRAAILSGGNRSASSSFISSDYLDSDGNVAVELWAMRGNQGGDKKFVEYEPPIVPVRYVETESVVAFSGVTSVVATLEAQIEEILDAIESSLALAGARWEDAAIISCHLHRSEPLEQLRSLLAPIARRTGPIFEYGWADGYSSPGKLIEIEVTAQRG